MLVSRLDAAAGALFPPKGEEKKSKVEAERHRPGGYQQRCTDLLRFCEGGALKRALSPRRIHEIS
jgi:hypothetical protein